MKLHEKILTRYLSSPSPVDKEGFLYKKRERTSTFHRRWFVLKGNLLFYQERPADRRLLGVVVLEGGAVRRADGGPLCFSLAFGPGLRTYRLAAEDRDGVEGWVTALLAATHCYLALLLRDLGRQYEEARQQQGRGDSSAGAVQQPRSFLFTSQGQRSEVRERRSLSAPAVSQPPAKAKKSPKLWRRRNAYVTPINGPAPPCGEWPAAGPDSLQDFGQLHLHYGQEVGKAREAWLRARRGDGRLVDLG